MSIKIILVVIFVALFSDANSQHTKTVELKPIHRQGFTYYYDFKKVHGGAYGLQIPLESLGDQEVNESYKKFKSIRSIEILVAFVPIFYLFAELSDHVHDSKTFWAVWGGSVVVSLALEIGAKSHLRKGIDRYNKLILEPSSKSVGAALTFKF